jgi:hypothetical protein
LVETLGTAVVALGESNKGLLALREDEAKRNKDATEQALIKADVELLKRLVYGGVALVLVAVGTAIIALVVSKGG